MRQANVWKTRPDLVLIEEILEPWDYSVDEIPDYKSTIYPVPLRYFLTWNVKEDRFLIACMSENGARIFESGHNSLFMSP